MPWKYGFKSIKSIVRICFLDDQPISTWQKADALEYGFYSNVNPEVDHPRWSQKRERRIGELRKRKTLMFNGYADENDHRYEQAIGYYLEALEYAGKEKQAENWAELQQLKANAHLAFAVRTKGKAIAQHFAQAVTAHRAALTVYTREHFPYAWKQSSQNLASAFNSISYELTKHPEHYAEAKELLEEAVSIAPDNPAFRDSLG